MKFEHLVRSITLIFMLIASSFIVKSSELSELNESGCLAGNGIWIVPKIAIGDDPFETQKNLTPYCSCDVGYFWNDTLRSCQNDSKLRCLQTEGEWLNNNSCECPEGTIKWTAGFGCDMPGPEPKIEKTENVKNLNLIKNFALSGAAILIFVTLFIIYNKSKHK